MAFQHKKIIECIQLLCSLFQRIKKKNCHQDGCSLQTATSFWNNKYPVNWIILYSVLHFKRIVRKRIAFYWIIIALDFILRSIFSLKIVITKRNGLVFGYSCLIALASVAIHFINIEFKAFLLSIELTRGFSRDTIHSNLFWFNLSLCFDRMKVVH